MSFLQNMQNNYLARQTANGFTCKYTVIIINEGNDVCLLPDLLQSGRKKTAFPNPMG